MRIAMLEALSEEHGPDVTGLPATLAAQDHDVTVFRRRGDRTTPREVVAEGGYRVVSLPAGPARRLTAAEVLGHAPEFDRAFGTALARLRPDVVHTRNWVTAPAAIAAAARHNIPVVHTPRCFGPLPDGSARIDQGVARAADLVTPTCHHHADAIIGAGVPRSRISVVPDGVDTDLFEPEGDRAPAGQRYRLVSFGGTAPHAGVSTAVAALRGVANAELVVIGPRDDDLHRYADELGVAGRVRFAGHVRRERRPALLRSADIVVCTPWHDPCPGSVLEAMACGTAVVVSAVGPLRDIVVTGVTGLVVPPHRPRVLAEALQRLLTQPSTREQYAASGRDRSCARYSWTRIATETLRAYERATQSPSPAQSNSSVRRGLPVGTRS